MFSRTQCFRNTDDCITCKIFLWTSYIEKDLSSLQESFDFLSSIVKWFVSENWFVFWKLSSGLLLLFKSIFCKSKGLNFNFSKSFFGVFILNEIIIVNLKNKTITQKHILKSRLKIPRNYVIVFDNCLLATLLTWSHKTITLFLSFLYNLIT